MTPEDIRAEKKTLRQELLSRRRTLSPEQRAHAGSVITAQVLPELKQAGTVMLYASMPEEIDLFPLMEELISAGTRIALPEITGRGMMEARELPAMDALTHGAFDIPTPDPARGARILPEEIDVVIVPGAAYDAGGGRLGLGGGYYDRFLPRATHAERLVLAFDFQIVPAVPMAAWDARVDRILTERRSMDCRNGRVKEG